MKKPYDPGIVIHTIQSEMDNILRRLHSDAMCACSTSRHVQWYPHVDIYETPESIIVLAECSGVSKEDLDISVKGNLLMLSGKRKDPLSGRGRTKAHNMEITYGAFKRQITIDIPFDQDKISASFENGFLSLTIPKEERAAKAIPIETPTAEESEE